MLHYTVRIYCDTAGCWNYAVLYEGFGTEREGIPENLRDDLAESLDWLLDGDLDYCPACAAKREEGES